MSEKVDERIVRMTFDNEKFEKGVSTTISTLDKLKSKLNFKGTETGIKTLQSSINSVSFSPINSGIAAVQAKFNALNVSAATVISEMTKKAMHAGESIADALTIGPVKSGFEEYETQLNAVQTILANTKNKGENINTVNDALNELNVYADETIYNFTEMTRNIGAFTAAGVGLKDSVAAIKGIANLAAMAGSTSNQASNAMYQLSQAIAAGKVGMQDWNSVVNAGMGGEVFQNALIEAAEELGVGAKDIVEKAGSFRESLYKDSWITSDIAIKALAKFTDTSTDLGKTATDAATKVKTITQLWDTLKEEVQSTWTQTWQYLIGDFEEAKDLLTKVKDRLVEIIAPMGAARNAVLEFWHDAGGRDIAIQALSKTFSQIEKLASPVMQAFKNIVPPMTGQKLLDMTKKFKDLTDQFNISESTITSIRNAFEGLFSIINLGWDIVSSTISVLLKYLKNFIGFGGSVLKMVGDLGTSVKKLTNRIVSSKVISKILGNIFTEKLAKNVSRIANGIMALFRILGKTLTTLTGKLNISGKSFEKLSKKVGKFLETLTSIFADVADLIVWFDKWIDKTDAINKGISLTVTAFDKFKSVLVDSAKAVDGFVESITGISIIKTIGSVIDKITDKVNRFKVQWTEVFYSMQNQHPDEPKILTILRTGFVLLTSFGKRIPKALKGIKLTPLLKPLNLLVDGFKHFRDSIANVDWSGFGSGLLKTLTDLKDKVATKLQAVWKSIKDTVNEIKDSLFSKEDTGKPTTIEEKIDAIRKGTDDIRSLKICDIIKAGLMGIVSILSSSGKLIISVIQTATKMVTGLDFSDILSAMNAASFYNISSGLKGFLDSMSGFANHLSGIAKGFEDLGKNVNNFIKELGETLKAFQAKAKADVLYTIAKSVAILAASIMLLALVPNDKILVVSGVVAGLVGELTGALIALTKIGKFETGLTGASSALLAMSSAVLILSFAFKNMSKLSAGELTKSITAISYIIGVFTAALIVISMNSDGLTEASKAIKAMSSAIKWMALVTVLLGAIKWETLEQGLVGVGTLALIIAVFIGVVSKIGPVNVAPIYAVAVAINLVSLALLPAVLSILALSLIPNLLKGILGFAAIIVALVSGLAILGKLKIDVKSVLAAAVAMDLISLALIPITAAIAILSLLDTGKMWGSIAALAVGLAGLTIVLTALGSAGPMVLVGAAALLVASASLVVFAVGMAAMIPVIVWFSKNAGTALKGIGVLGLAIIAFGVACTIAAPGVILLATGFLIFGAAVFMIGIGITILAVGLTTLAGALTLISKLDMKALVDNIVNFFTQLGQNAGKIATSIIQIFIDVLEALTTAIPQLVDTILVFLIELLKKINDHITELTELVVSILVGIAGGAMMGLFDWIAENADTYMSKLVIALSAWIDVLADHLPDLQRNIIQAVKRFFKAMKKNIDDEIITPIKEWISGKFKGIFDNLFGDESIFSKVKDFGGKIVGKISDGITGAFDKIKNVAKNVADTVLGAFGLSKSKKAAEKATEDDSSGNFFDNFIDAATIAKESIEKFIEFVKVNSEVKPYQDLGKKLSDGIMDGFKQNIITSGLLKLKEPSSELLKAASQAFKASDYNTIGKNIVDGIITGIKTKQTDLNTALSDMASASVDATNESLGIHSPSRVFAETGRYIILGLIKGIKSTKDVLSDTMSNISDETISTMDTLFNDLDVSFASGSFTPSITPVLNMGSLSSSLGNINSSFATQSLKLKGLNGDITANIADSMDGFVQNDNSDIVNELYNLRNDVNQLNESVGNMKVVMDSGELVGSISGKMNNTLGKRTLLTKRGGI